MIEDANNHAGLMTSDEVADMLRIDEATLKRWRMEGRGPRWMKMGDSQNSPVRYRRAEVAAYLDGLPQGPAA